VSAREGVSMELDVINLDGTSARSVSGPKRCIRLEPRPTSSRVVRWQRYNAQAGTQQGEGTRSKNLPPVFYFFFLFFFTPQKKRKKKYLRQKRARAGARHRDRNAPSSGHVGVQGPDASQHGTS